MLGDQDKPWASHIVCKPYVEHLRQWTNKSKKSLRFVIPMVWREPQGHRNDCYFCAMKTKGINRKNRNSLTYPNLDSAIRPVPHSEELPVAVFEGLPQLESSLSSEEEDVSIDSNNTLADNGLPPLFYPRNSSQGQLNDLARDLNLSKESSELLASRLKEKNLSKPGTLTTFYRKSLNVILTIGDVSLIVVKEVWNVLFCIMIMFWIYSSWAFNNSHRKR